MRVHISGRIVEAYIGEYASGKSEIAVNRAVMLANKGHVVSLVDFDFVEPCYTLRPLKKQLTAKGIQVLAWETRETIGLGETGNVIPPANRWALRRSGDIILDVGYGVEGARTLNLLEGADKDPDLKILVVINISRPMTSSLQDIISYVQQLGRVDGLVNNTHLGDETTLKVVQQGYKMIQQAANSLGIPVVSSVLWHEIAGQGEQLNDLGNEVWIIQRYMPSALW